MDLQAAFEHVLDKLGPFESQPHLALAVSGGSDSMALAFLCQQWCRKHQGQLTCLIVDHGLRVDSTQEAHEVQQRLLDYKIPGKILTWTGPKPKRRVQEQARQARYDLLMQWCVKHHVLHLLTGHHQDDQRETYQLRHAKDSGPLGLAGMSALIETPHVRLLRPLLAFSKSQLRAFLDEHGIFFVEDPSNSNLKYTRAVLRQQNLTDLDKEEFHQSCQDYGKHRLQEEMRLNDLVSRCVSVQAQGYGIINRSFYQNVPEEDQINLLQRCLMTFGAGHYVPACASLKALNERLQQSPLMTQTLQGCVIFAHKNQMYITREPAQIKSVTLCTSFGTIWWDERFWIQYSGVQEGDVIAPLGQQGWCQVNQRAEFKSLINDIKSLPAFIRFGLPSLWRGSKCFNLWHPGQNFDLLKTKEMVYSEFTTKEVYDIHFSPRYPLTRFTFMIV